MAWVFFVLSAVVTVVAGTFGRGIRTQYRHMERLTLMKAGVAAFILTSGDLQGEEMAQIFAKTLPRITRFLKSHAKPFIAKIANDGSVSLLIQ
ncbi:MAG: hypothetical protein Q7U39_01385 [Nitrospira sp.]|nr:hypothetical protein [Nitrospira sp.]